ncbi:MAG: helix-turn-helix domain-containing protein [bacterium]
MTFCNNKYMEKYNEHRIQLLQNIGDRLRKIRLANNMTQEELASKAGFSRSYYTEIETGKRNTSIFNLYKLIKSLGITFDEFFDDFQDEFI